MYSWIFDCVTFFLFLYSLGYTALFVESNKNIASYTAIMLGAFWLFSIFSFIDLLDLFGTDFEIISEFLDESIVSGANAFYWVNVIGGGILLVNKIYQFIRKKMNQPN